MLNPENEPCSYTHSINSKCFISTYNYPWLFENGYFINWNNHKFDLPEGILDDEFHNIWHRLEHAKKDNALDDDDKNLSDEELKKRYKKISKRRVKLALLIQFIAKEEKISISEKELTDGMIN